MDTYVAKVQIGDNSSNLSPIASTMFGVCSSSGTATTKIVTFNKFDKLIHGVTIFVRFTNGNSLPGNLKLQVNNTLAYDITGDCICGENEIIAFTFDEVDATHKYWRANSSGISSAMKEFIINTINTSTDTPDVLIMKGGVGTGGNPGYLPSTDYEVGWTYRVVTAGTYIGQKCEVGDLIVAIQNATSSQLVTNPSHWIIIQGKLQNVVTNAGTSTDSHVVIFDGTTGKLITDSGFTINKSVPADAKFTDTTYTNGTGLNLNNNTFSVEYGNTAGTAAQGNDPRLSDARTPTSHTHGNITNDGTIGNGNALLRTTDGEITAGPALGNDSTKFLNNAGNWVTPPVTSVNNQTGDVVIDLSGLNIDAMRFIGQATVNIVAGSNTNPQISGYTWPDDRKSGDVILGKDDDREYVLSLDNEWILLGQDALSDVYTVAGATGVNEFIDSITQRTDRSIIVTKKVLDTTGTWSGNAATATQFLNPQKVYVDLETESVNTTIQGGSSEAQVIGIDGILGITNGGTGTNSFNINEVIISDNTNGYTSLLSRAYTDNTSAVAFRSDKNYFITERSIYYGLPFINNSHSYASDVNIFAPETGGLAHQILIANSATTAPVWAQAAFISSEASDTAGQNAYTTITLGNNISNSSSSAHSEGKIVIYSSDTNSHILIGTATSTTDYTHTLPNADGILLQIPNLTAIGSNYNPIYIAANGVITALTYTPNRLYYSASAPSGESISHEFLPSNHYASGTQISIGATTAPAVTDVLQVAGNATFTSIVKLTDTTDASSTITGTLRISGGVGIAKQLYIGGIGYFENNLQVDGTTKLVNNVGIGGNPETGASAHLLYVNGTSNLNGTVEISGITSITNNTTATASTGALIVTGGILTETNLYVSATSQLVGNVGINTSPDSALVDNHVLKINGSFLMVSDNTSIVHLDQATNSILMNFSPHAGYDGSIGLIDHRWTTGFFYNTLEVGTRTSNSDPLQGVLLDSSGTLKVQNSTSIIELDTTLDNDAARSEINIESGASNIDLYTSGASNALEGQITITTTVPTILLDTVTANVSNWIITNTAGVFSLNNQQVNSAELKGMDKGFEIYPRLYINTEIPNIVASQYTFAIGGNTFSEGNIIPAQNVTLGSSDNRWSGVYIGSADNYGNAYTPIYWNNGVPTPLDGTVQYKEFSFSANDTSITLTSPAYDTHTCVLQIVVTSGIENLNGVITSSVVQNISAGADGQITLTTTATSGTVTGYILTSYGCNAPVASASSNT